MSARWLVELCGYDCETTGPEPFEARIVSAAVVHLGPAGIGRERTWLIWPGVEIPAAANAIHGITSQHAREHGEQPETAVPDIAAELLAAWAAGKAVVAMNANYDLTVLQAELARNGHGALEIGPVLDPFVIDREMDKYRKGKRTLSALAAHYNVTQGAAHTAGGDVLTAARIVWRQAHQYKALQSLTLEQMQIWQRDAHARRQADYEQYLRRQGKHDVIEREWPVRRPKGAA